MLPSRLHQKTTRIIGALKSSSRSGTKTPLCKQYIPTHAFLINSSSPLGAKHPSHLISNRPYSMDSNQNGDAKKKTYHKKATGPALETAEKHSGENEMKLFGSCFWWAWSAFIQTPLLLYSSIHQNQHYNMFCPQIFHWEGSKFWSWSSRKHTNMLTASQPFRPESMDLTRA